MEIMVNGELREVAEGATVAKLLAELGLAKQFVAVELNRQVIPRARHAECPLNAGDTLEIVTLVGGG
jgi:thiamine biosynthesis protein ThiS